MVNINHWNQPLELTIGIAGIALKSSIACTLACRVDLLTLTGQVFVPILPTVFL